MEPLPRLSGPLAPRWTFSEPPRASKPDVTTNSKSGKMKMDKHGRLNYSYPCTGRLFIVACAAKFSGCSAVSHARDLKNVIGGLQADDKNAMFLVVDGGPDFRPKH